ncbi:MAG: enoyl-CoA hydratase [Myxococcota bacterium]|jgi:enoyl-CoA hydratase
MTQPSVTVERVGHVTQIGLNEPKKLNSFGLIMLRELAEAYTAFEADPEARCAVLFAHGDHFTSGLRLDEVGPAVARGDKLFPEDSVDPLDLFGPRRTKPVIGVVQGWCLTIGIELLLACDIRVAASGTRFSQLEVKRGIMPFGGATLRFPQIAGWGNAMRWLLTGEEFGPEEALRIGMIQEITPLGEELSRGMALAGAVGRAAPLAVQASRASSRLAVEGGFEAGRERLMDGARGLMDSADAYEGVQSFLERREARFTGE